MTKVSLGTDWSSCKTRTMHSANLHCNIRMCTVGARPASTTTKTPGQIQKSVFPHIPSCPPTSLQPSWRGTRGNRHESENRDIYCFRVNLPDWTIFSLTPWQVGLSKEIKLVFAQQTKIWLTFYSTHGKMDIVFPEYKATYWWTTVIFLNYGPPKINCHFTLTRIYFSINTKINPFIIIIMEMLIFPLCVRKYKK